MASNRNELAIPGGDNKLVIPAHIAAAFGAPEDQNIIAGDRVNTLGVKGKMFWVTLDGETVPMMRTDSEGNEYPVPALPVVILDYAVKTGRSYYESGYVDGETSAPVCWSEDSITPSEQVDEEVKTEITSHKCQGCPKSLKGSATTDDGKMAAACKVHRLLAVVPARRLDLAPMRLRIAQTSNFDGKSPDLKLKQQYAFQNYLDSLKARGVLTIQSIVTKLSFDPAKAFPKLLFQAIEFLNDEQVAKVKEILDSGVVEDILGGTGTRSLNKPKAAALPTAKATSLPKPAAVVIPADEDEEVGAEPAPAPAPKAAAPKAKAAAAKAAPAKAAAAPAKAAASKLTVPETTEEQDEVMAELETEASAATTAKLKASIEAEAPAEEDDEEAAALRAVEAIRAKKAAAAAAAAKAAAAPAPKAAAPKPRATSIDVGGEDEPDAEILLPPKKAAAGKPKAAAQTIEAVPLAVPAEVASLIGDWGSDE